MGGVLTKNYVPPKISKKNSVAVKKEYSTKPIDAGYLCKSSKCGIVLVEKSFSILDHEILW